MRKLIAWGLVLFCCSGFVMRGGGGAVVNNGVQALFQNGQTFVTWPDQATGSAGNNWRYSMYRSTSPLNSGNCESATLIASHIFNNSAQLLGGQPQQAGFTGQIIGTNLNVTVLGSNSGILAPGALITGGIGIAPNTYVVSGPSAGGPGNYVVSPSQNLGPETLSIVTPGAPFVQMWRQNASMPMSVLSFGGTPLPVYSGLQVYTALATQTAYYCIEANPQPSGTDVFVGAAGPVSESVATPAPIEYLASTNRGFNYGHVNCGTSCSGMPVIINAHASDAGGGTAKNGEYGDIWQFWGNTSDGYQDGRATIFNVLEDGGSGGTSWPGQTNSLVIGTRDTWWSPDGNSSLETYHQGVGMSPNPLVGTANKMYLSTANEYQQFFNFAVSHYGANPNNIHWTGTSMGAWGGANTGLHMTSPEMAGLWLFAPVWRMDHRSSAGWPGSGWGNYPFAATLGAAPSTMGTNAAAINLITGPVWGGTGGYVDEPSFITSSPGTDLPFVDFVISMQDPYGLWPDEVAAVNALESANRGFAFVWNQGLHGDYDSWNTMGALINCNNTGDSADCYHMSTFALGQAYLAFSNSSIDDNIGTGTLQPNGLYDGAFSGCKDCGFHWTVSSDTSGAFNFTVSNTWMDNVPTPDPTTTLTGTIAASGGGTVTVTNGAVFATAASTNPYFLVSNTEVIVVTTVVGNTVTFTSRGQLGTTAQTHNIGDSIEQFIKTPTGPTGGPFSSMTVNITPRRRQSFLPTPTTVVPCIVTPNGGSPSTINSTVAATGLFTIVGVPINSSGSTSVTCS